MYRAFSRPATRTTPWPESLLVLLVFVASGCGGSGATSSAREGSTAANQVSSVATVDSKRGTELLARPLAGDGLSVTVHRLDNGLTVYLSPDREQPQISARIVVRAGSRHDPAESTGLSHYLEHMLFKGTAILGTLDGSAEKAVLDRIQHRYASLYTERDSQRRQQLLAEIDRHTQSTAPWIIPNELNRLYSRLGITEVNAFTAADATTFLATLPSVRLAQWARIEAERLAHPSFRLFLPELEVVYEEKNEVLDSPELRMTEELLAALYPAHPYGTQTPIGRAEHLKNPAFGNMIRHFERWYVPDNMAIVLAGDVDAETALPILQSTFGRWTRRLLPPSPPGDLRFPAGRQFREIFAEIEQSVNLAWRTVTRDHDDAAALAVMDMLLDNGRSGMLKADLVTSGKVMRAGAHPIVYREAGAWMMAAGAREGQQLEEVERLLLAEVEKVRRGDFSEHELQAIVLNNEITEQVRLETTDSRASVVANSFVFDQRWSAVVDRLARLRAVRKSDVVRVANRYLGGDFVVVYRRKGMFSAPKLPKVTFTPLAIDPDRQSAFARDVERFPVRTVEPRWAEQERDYWRGRIPAGKLLASLNTRNRLFRLEYIFDLGSRRLPLICHALRLQRNAGAGDLSVELVQRQLFSLGSSVETTCAAEETKIVVEGTDENMETTLRLLDRWFREPRFGEKEVVRLKETTLAERKTDLDDPRTCAEALQEFSLRGEESSWRRVPSNNILSVARAEELRVLLRSFLDNTHKTLYFGPRPIGEAARAVALGRNHRSVGSRPPARMRPLSRSTIYVQNRNLVQAQISVAFPGSPLRKQDQATALVLSQYLGQGLEGAVAQTVRESEALAYSASASLEWGQRPRDAAALIATIETETSKASRAIEQLVGLLRAARVDAARVSEVKLQLDQMLTSTRPKPRKMGTLVDNWDEYGERGDPRARLRAAVAAVQPEDLVGFWRRVAKRPFVVAVTGNRADLDLQRLARLAPVREVEGAELFGYGPFPSVGGSAQLTER